MDKTLFISEHLRGTDGFFHLPDDVPWGYGLDALANRTRLWIATNSGPVTRDMGIFNFQYNHKENGFDVFRCINCTYYNRSDGDVRVRDGKVYTKFALLHLSDCMVPKDQFDLMSAVIACCLHPPTSRYKITTFTVCTLEDIAREFYGLSPQGYERLQDIETVGDATASPTVRCKACSSSWVGQYAVAWIGRLDYEVSFLLEDLWAVHSCGNKIILPMIMSNLPPEPMRPRDVLIHNETESDKSSITDHSCDILKSMRRKLDGNRRKSTKRYNARLNASFDSTKDKSRKSSHYVSPDLYASDSHVSSLSSLPSTNDLESTPYTSEPSSESEASSSTATASLSELTLSSSASNDIQSDPHPPSLVKPESTPFKRAKVSALYFQVLQTPIFIERPSLNWLRRCCAKLNLPRSSCETAYSDYWGKLETSCVYPESTPIEYFSISNDAEFFSFIFSGTTKPTKLLKETASDIVRNKIDIVSFDLSIYEMIVSGEDAPVNYSIPKLKKSLCGSKFIMAHLLAIAMTVGCRFLVFNGDSWHVWGDASTNDIPTVMLKVNGDGMLIGVTKASM